MAQVVVKKQVTIFDSGGNAALSFAQAETGNVVVSMGAGGVPVGLTGSTVSIEDIRDALKEVEVEPTLVNPTEATTKMPTRPTDTPAPA